MAVSGGQSGPTGEEDLTIGVGEGGKQACIVVGNPVVECPARNIIALSPPSGEESADATVIHFAAALAATVTNPYDTVLGFSVWAHYLVTARGRVRIDPKNGVGFNAHGLNHSNYLLPAVWDLNDSSCLTTV
ncbi:hypothetical protein RJ640_028406 [Escallonia rubra]|uniref:Uncharacterized protein n=1 Tax=Escallonia rubra TaxID=112253 RepID=A0AA88REE6_9ASTE|nr:hypothetical protein RJ640_028406 [Escallonia rubra]